MAGLKIDFELEGYILNWSITPCDVFVRLQIRTVGLRSPERKL